MSKKRGFVILFVAFVVILAWCGHDGGRALASGIASVVSVFGQTGVVNIPVTTTDISTPSAPGSGKTIWYTKGGLLCSENPSSVESCVGGGGGGPTTNQNVRTPQVTFDGGGSALTGTTTRCASGFYSGTIQQVDLIADVSGSATVDVQTVAFSSYTGPGSASTISRVGPQPDLWILEQCSIKHLVGVVGHMEW